MGMEGADGLNEFFVGSNAERVVINYKVLLNPTDRLVIANKIPTSPRITKTGSALTAKLSFADIPIESSPNKEGAQRVDDPVLV